MTSFHQAYADPSPGIEILCVRIFADPLRALFAVLGLALLWSVLVRLPFLWVNEADDSIYDAISFLWTKGYLPYRDAYDVKPPGIFALDALARHVFGGGLAPLRAIEIVSDAIISACLYYMGSRMGSRAAGWLAALLFPPLSVFAICNAAYSPLCAFTTLAFASLLTPWPLFARALGAGLAIGATCCIKQTAAFEGIVVLAALITWPDIHGGRVRVLAAFGAAAVVAPLAFLIYFAAHGAAGALAEATIGGAMARAHSPLENLSFWQGLERAPRKLLTIEPLLLGAALAYVRRDRKFGPDRAALLLVGAWIAASLASFLVQHAIIVAYGAPLIAPTLLLASFAVVDRSLPLSRLYGAPLLLGATALFFAVHWPADHVENRPPEGLDRVAEIVRSRAPGANDRLYVVNHGVWPYAATGLAPPTPYLVNLITLCELLPGGERRLIDIFDARPRFVIVGDRRVRAACEMEARWEIVEARLRSEYRRIGVVDPNGENYEIFERAPEPSLTDETK